MLEQILLVIAFLCALLTFFLAQKIADRFFGGKDKAVVTLKIVGGVGVLVCTILAAIYNYTL